jgi:hypothetical protein
LIAELINRLLSLLDAFLIAPYRWPRDPIWGWWLGTLLLALWCYLAGRACLAGVSRINREQVRRHNQEMLERQNQSLGALRAGDKTVYRGLNKMANEAFGKGFFLQIAMGASAMWPAFLGLAWLQARFQGLEFYLPWPGVAVNYAAGFIAEYIALWAVIAYLKKRLGRPGGGGKRKP